MKKRLLSLLLAIVMVVGMVPGVAFAAETVDSGTTGDCTWTLDSDGVFTVSGNGAMASSYTDGSQPWYAYKDSITTVIVAKGVTSISERAFYNFVALETVKIAGSVTSVGNNAFSDTTSTSGSMTAEYYGSSNPGGSNVFVGRIIKFVKVLSTYSGTLCCGKSTRVALNAADEPVSAVPATYAVTVDPAITGGTVTADKASAAEGDTVTLTVTPAEGYEIDTVSVSGTAILPKEGVYSFTMPAKDVTVTATFSKKAAAEGSGTEGDPYILHDGDNSFDVEKELWHYFQYTATADGTLSVTVGTSTGKWYSHVGSSFKWDTQPEAVEMTAGETYLISIRIYTDSSDKWGGCAGTATLNVQFTGTGSTEPAPVYTVEITADKDTITLGETVTLTAAVKADGVAVENAEVSWEGPSGSHFAFIEDEPLKVTATPETAGEKEFIVIYDPVVDEEGDEITASVTVTVTAPAPDHIHCVCGTDTCAVGGHSHADVNWTAWTSTDSLPTEEGSYYLTADVTLTAVATMGANIDLCLNGHRIDLNRKNITVTGGTVNFTDCSTPSAGVITNGGGTTINTNNCGGAIAITGGTFSLYGGTVTGNSARFGGGICAKAKFNMYGGTVKGNTATASSGTCNGGGVLIDAASNLYGGLITENHAKTSGGGVYLNSPSSKVYVYGVTVTGNTAGTYGGGLYYLNGEIHLKGAAVITGNTVQGQANNLYLDEGARPYVSGRLPVETEIGVTLSSVPNKVAAGWTSYMSSVAKEDIPDYFVSDNSGYAIELQGNDLWMVVRKYTVTVDGAVANGTVTASGDSFKAGDTVTLTVTPAEGYEPVSVSYDDGEEHVITPVDGVYSFTMPAADVTVSAVFERFYQITVNYTGNGAVTADKTKAAEGETVTLTVTTDENYYQVWLLVDGNDVTDQVVDGKYTFTMPDHDVEVAADFWLLPPTVVITDEDGNVIPTDGTGVLEVGKTYTATVTGPDTGYRLLWHGYDWAERSYWKTLASGTEFMLTYEDYLDYYQQFADRAFPLTLDGIYLRVNGESESGVAYPVTFKLAPPPVYNVTVDTTDGGTVTADPIKTPEGYTVTLTVDPDENYRLAWLSVDGKYVTDQVVDGKYTFTMPDHDVEVKAVFRLLPPAVVITDEDGNVIPTDGTGVLEVGKTYTAAVTGPDTGYTLHWNGFDWTKSLYWKALANGMEFGLSYKQYLEFYEEYANTTPALNMDGIYLQVSGEIESGEVCCVLFKLAVPPVYEITVDTKGSGIVTADLTSAPEGETVTLTVTPGGNYGLAWLTVDGEYVTDQVVDGKYTFTMPDHDVEVKATFRLLPPTVVITDEDGNVIPTDGTGVLEVGKTYTATVTGPDTGYRLYWNGFDLTRNVYWKTLVNGVEFGLTYREYLAFYEEFANARPAMTLDGTYLQVFGEIEPSEVCYARFKLAVPPVYDITVSPAEMGTVTADLSEAPAGETVNLTVTPDEGCELVSLTVTAENGRSITVTDNKFVMPAGDVTVTAVFKKTPVITVTDSKGNVIPMDGTGVLVVGETYTVTYEFCELTNLSWAPQDAAEKMYGGSAYWLGTGEEFIFDAAAYRNGERWQIASEFSFDSVYLSYRKDGELTHASFGLSVEFHTVTVDFGPNGTVTADLTEVLEGETVTLTVTPDAYYQLGSLYLDGLLSGNIADQVIDGELTFTMPANDVEVSGHFRWVPVVTVTDEDGNVIPLDGTGVLTVGKQYTVSVEPGDTYTIIWSGMDRIRQYSWGEICIGAELDFTYALYRENYKLLAANDLDFNGVFLQIRKGTNRLSIQFDVEVPPAVFTVTDSKGNVIPTDGTGTLVVGETYTINYAFCEVGNPYWTPASLSTNMHGGGAYWLGTGETFLFDAAAYRIGKGWEAASGYTFNRLVLCCLKDDVENYIRFRISADLHTVTVKENENGTVTADLTEVLEGETVTLTVTPKVGYELVSITVTDKSGDPVTVTGNTFMMPDENVTVRSSFRKIPAAAPSVTGTEGVTLTYGYTEGSISVTATAAEGHTLSYQWYSADGTAIDGATAASCAVPGGLNVGTYGYYCVVTATHTDSGETASATSAVVTVTVEPKAVSEPTVKGTYTYTGTEQTVELEGVESFMTIVSGDKATDAGTYEIRIELDANHIWADGSDGKVYWNIGKAQAVITVDTTPIVVTYGDTVTLPEATSNFGTVTVSKSDMTNVGTYTVTYTVADSDNWGGTQKSVTVTVTQREIGLHWVAPADLVYSGQAKTVYATATGLMDGDNCAVTVVLVGDNVNVGTFRYTATALSNDNYKLPAEVNSPNYTIAPKPVTVTAEDKTKTYGDADPALTYTVSGLVGEDQLTGALTREQGENVGEYAIRQGTLAVGSNYELIFVAGKLTIGKAQAVITVDTTPIVVTYGDALTLPTATANFGTVTVDAPEMVNVGTYTVTYTVAATDNWNGATKTLSVTVNPKPVAEPTVKGAYTYTGKEQTVVLEGVESFMTVASGNKGTDAGEYEVVIELDANHIWADGSDGKVQWNIGKAQAVITVDTAPITVVYGETVTLPEATSNFGTVTCDKTPADLVNYGTYTVTYAVADSANWIGTQVSITVTVAPKPVAEPTVKGTYTYTGNQQTVELEGVESFMTVVSGTKATDAGEYEVVIELDANHIWADGSDGKVQWTIGKAQAVITVDTDPIVVTYGETVTLPTATSNFGTVTVNAPDMTNAGTYTVTYTVADSANWVGTQVSVTVTVEKKAITVTAEDKTKTYGDADPALTYTVEGLVGEDRLTGSLTREQGENVGTYAILQGTLAASGNYELTFVEGKLTVNKKALTVTANDNTITYGDAPANAGVSYAGFVFGEDATVLGGTLAYTYSYEQYENVGAYVIMPSGLTSGNYDITFRPGTLTVVKKALTVTAKDAEITYGEAPINNGVTYEGFVGGQDETVLTGELTYTYGYKQYDDTGRYAITPGGLKAVNYDITFVDGILTVGKKAAHITVIDKMFMISFDAPDLSKPTVGKDYTVTGLVNGDSVDLVVMTCNADMYKAGNYAIYVSAEDVNYTFTYTFGTLTVVAGSGDVAGSGPNTTVVCNCHRFLDVDVAAWYHPAVCFAVNNGIMNGTGKGSTFSPYMNLSRAMMMTMLARLDGVNTQGGTTWYEKGMKWAMEEGISDGTNLEADITREQMVTMLYRYAGSPAVAGDYLAGYPDGAQVSSWAKTAMNWAVVNGIVQGNGQGLNPQGTATRAEVAQILYNYLNK